jgi:peptidoglycan/xylan/chitin deacetylase (PgdA/CDA1 family)
MVWTTALLAMLAIASATNSVTAGEAPPQRFVAIALHDVVDTPSELDDDSVTSDRLVVLFEWLAGNGWTAISLDDIDRARRGIKPLPPRAVLLTVDDGYRSLYTRVYPLALAYRTPIVAAVVGQWMDTPADGAVRYGQRLVPRSNFITWDQAREMQASGLIEFASHSHALHDVVLANPQGNPLAAAQTLRYADGRYETLAAFQSRIRADLGHARERMQQELGKPPRAIVWPYGRYNQQALDVASGLGFQFAMTLSPAPADAAHPLAIGRFLPTGDPELDVMVTNLRFIDPWPSARRIVEVSPEALLGADAEATNQRLGQTIERLLALGATHVVVDAATVSTDGRLESVWFPTPLMPARSDVLSRICAQLHARAGVDVIVRLPHTAVLATMGDQARGLALYRDLASHVPFEALLLENVPSLGESPASPLDNPWDVQRRRAASDTASWPREDAFAMQAFHVAELERPDLELYWLAPDTRSLDRPSGIAELTLVPRDLDAPPGDGAPRLEVPLSRRVGLWWTQQSPPNSSSIARAARAFQIRGGTAFGWRPDDPMANAPRTDLVAPAFSAREAPAQGYKP